MTGERLVLLQPDDDRLCEEAYNRVFRPGFDSTELPSISGVQPASGRAVLIALDDTGVVAGGVSDSFPECGIGLLSYLAARPDVRSRGLGARVLDGLRDQWSDSGPSLVVGEVRDPRAWTTTETDRPADRLRFYARHGCHLLPVPWVQPAIDHGARETGLLLISVHGTSVGTIVAAERLAQWAAQYYCDAEGAEPDDRQYDALIRRLRARDHEVIRIDDYDRVAPLGSDAETPGRES